VDESAKLFSGLKLTNLGSESDPFVKISVCGKDKKELKGNTLKTPSKEDTSTI
jgi:hypothetical protein